MINDIGAGAPKIQHYQTIMLASDMEELMKATSTPNHSDALASAAAEVIKRFQKRKVVAQV